MAQLRGRLNQPPRDPSQSPSLGSRLSPGSDRDRDGDERRQHTPGPGSGAGAGAAHGYLNQSQSQQAIMGYGPAYGSRDAQGFLTGHGHGHGHGHDPGEGSWRGSSPSSTMTSSATVMSPESTGSENGSGSGSGSGFPVATGYVPQVADVDGSGVSGDALVLGREFLLFPCGSRLCCSFRIELTSTYRFTGRPDHVGLLCGQSWSVLFSG